MLHIVLVYTSDLLFSNGYDLLGLVLKKSSRFLSMHSIDSMYIVTNEHQNAHHSDAA